MGLVRTLNTGITLASRQQWRLSGLRRVIDGK